MMKLLRLVGLLEGLSFLALLFFSMPMKYLMNEPQYIYPVGMAHGVLFMGYILLVGFHWLQDKWTFRDGLAAMLCSVIPAGTFWADAKIFKKYEEQPQ